MPDSWILIIITVLIIFILFYMSNRMICLSAKARESAEEKNREITDASIHYIQSESLPSSPRFASVHEPCNNNNCQEDKPLGCETTSLESRVESRLRSQMFNLLLAEKEHQQLEMDVRRLAQVLSVSQGVNAEECVNKVKRELSPLMEVASFQPQRRSYTLLSDYLHDLTIINPDSVTQSSQDKNDPLFDV